MSQSNERHPAYPGSSSSPMRGNQLDRLLARLVRCDGEGFVEIRSPSNPRTGFSAIALVPGTEITAEAIRDCIKNTLLPFLGDEPDDVVFHKELMGAFDRLPKGFDGK